MKLSSMLLVCWLACIPAGNSYELRPQETGVTRIRVPEDPEAAALHDLLAAAQAAMERKDYQTAVQDYQDYLAKKPNDAVTHFNLGYVYTAMQRPSDAKAEYEKAISLDPKMAVAYVNLGLTLLDTDPRAAIAPLQRAVALAPNEAHPRYVLGLALERAGDLPGAIEQYDAAEKLDDKDFNVHHSLGRALLSSSRPADAEPEFRRAITLRPDSSLAHVGFAQTLLAEGKLEAADSELAAYLEAKPGDIEARLEHASVLLDLHKNDDALRELDKAATFGPEGIRALKLRSQIYFEQKRFDDNVPVLQSAARLAPRDPDIPAQLGHLYLEKKDYPNAVRELITASKMDPSSNDVLGDLVTAQYLNKNYPAALQGLDLLSQRKSLPAGTWFLRATCYDRLGQRAEALEAYQKFLQLNKDAQNDMYFEATARARTLARELGDKKR